MAAAARTAACDHLYPKQPRELSSQYQAVLLRFPRAQGRAGVHRVHPVTASPKEFATPLLHGWPLPFTPATDPSLEDMVETPGQRLHLLRNFFGPGIGVPSKASWEPKPYFCAVTSYSAQTGTTLQRDFVLG